MEHFPSLETRLRPWTSISRHPKHSRHRKNIKVNGSGGVGTERLSPEEVEVRSCATRNDPLTFIFFGYLRCFGCLKQPGG